MHKLLTSYYFLAEDPDLRSQHQKEAIMSLEIAVTLDNTSWESHYELAFQQFQARDLLSASASITRSLQLNKSYLPSWHLLALLYSCPQVEKLPEALQTLELAVGETHIMENNDTIINLSSAGLPVMSWTGEKNCRDVLVAAESVINIHLSQLACMAKLDGPDSVLPELADLFTLYNVMTTHLGITDLMEMEQSHLFSGTASSSARSSISTSQRNYGRKVSRPEIKSITTINSPVVNSASSPAGPRANGRAQQQVTPPSSLDDLEEPGTPSPSNTTTATITNVTMTDESEAPSFVRRRRSGGSLTSFSSNPALIENIKSHTPSTPTRTPVYNGLPDPKVNVVRRGSQSLKKSLYHMESSLSRRNSNSVASNGMAPKTSGSGM
jgi:hypothetical protein